MSIKKEENDIRIFIQKYVHKKPIIKTDSEFTNFLNIMKEQEQWKQKLNTIQSFRVTRSRLNKALILQVKVKKYNRWITVSWRNGIKKKRNINVKNNDLQSAFRHSIKFQIKQWRRENFPLTAVCANCNSTNNLQVDHKTPSFKQLTEDFLQKSINCDNIPTSYDYHKGGKKFKKRDRLFNGRWKIYHKKKATYQWLCKSCNLSKSNK